MPKKNLIIGIVLTACIFSLGFFFYFLKEEAKVRPLPFLGQVEAFGLTDSNARAFTQVPLEGKVWVANFIFTTCSGICPLMTKNMAQLYRSYLLIDGVDFVSFSVNPENDTPQALSQYAKEKKADTRRWHFLTGTREAIQAVAVKSFKLGTIEEPIFHSGKFALVDRHLRIRGYYEGTSAEELPKLFKDVAALLRERE